MADPLAVHQHDAFGDLALRRHGVDPPRHDVAHRGVLGGALLENDPVRDVALRDDARERVLVEHYEKRDVLFLHLAQRGEHLALFREQLAGRRERH